MRRYTAIFVAVLGLVLPWGAACQTEIPLVQVEDVALAAPAGQVRVSGVVTRYPEYDSLTERLTFRLDDGTGTLLVVLDREESRALLGRSQEVPTVGDHVSVAGIVRVQIDKLQGDLILLTVRKPEYLSVERPAPVDTTLGDAAAGPQYRKVRVEGQVSELWQPDEGLTILRIRDGTGEIEVVYDQNLVWISGAPTTVLPGDFVRVRGAVVDQGGRPRIVLDEASALQRLPALVRRGDGGEPAAAQPVVAPQPSAAAQPPAAVATEEPRRATPAAVAPALPTATALVRTSVPALPTSLSEAAPEMSVSPTPGDRAEGNLGAEQLPVQTGVLSEAHLGSSVTVEGRIEQATLLSAGCKSFVNDGTGPAVVWMPNALYGQLVDPEGWNVGALVRVSGRVSEYEDELEVVPESQGAVVIVQRALIPSAPDAQIGNLAAGELGRRVTVEATILSLEPFSAGVKCLIDDGSGQAVLLLWQNVFEALADRELFVVGRRLFASGWVQEYRGELEIVPGVPYDLILLER